MTPTGKLRMRSVQPLDSGAMTSSSSGSGSCGTRPTCPTSPPMYTVWSGIIPFPASAACITPKCLFHLEVVTPMWLRRARLTLRSRLTLRCLRASARRPVDRRGCRRLRQAPHEVRVVAAHGRPNRPHGAYHRATGSPLHSPWNFLLPPRPQPHPQRPPTGRPGEASTARRG